MLFDGVCVLCSRGCLFVSKRDRRGYFRFVAIQLAEGRPLAEQLGINPDHPDSFAFVAAGQGYVKSEAVLRIARELPRWQWTWVFHFIPRVIRDAIYDLVARNRYRWFGRRDACILPKQIVRGHRDRPETAGRWHLALNANALSLEVNPKLLSQQHSADGEAAWTCRVRSIAPLHWGRVLAIVEHAIASDETAYWRDETSATPATEVYTAVLPGLARTNGVLVAISTPYRKMGLLYQKFRDCYGSNNDNILVVQGASKTFNPTLSDAIISAQRAADPTGSGAEWDAVFRDDLASFLDDQSIDAAVQHGRPLELPARDGVAYFTFVDMSGGRHDLSTIAIAHFEGEGDDRRYVVDVMRGRRRSARSCEGIPRACQDVSLFDDPRRQLQC